MQNKRMITAMIVAFMVIVGYKLFIDWLWQKNHWQMPQPQAAATQPLNPTGTASTTEPSSVASATTAPSNAVPTTQASGIRVVGASSVEPASIGSLADKDPTYAMWVKLLAQGAAIDEVALNQFKLEVGKPDPYTFDQLQDGNRLGHAQMKGAGSKELTDTIHSFDQLPIGPLDVSAKCVVEDIRRRKRTDWRVRQQLVARAVMANINKNVLNDLDRRAQTDPTSGTRQGAQQFPAHEAENHGGQGRDEVDRLVAAVVFHEGLFPGQLV